jgi:hypothetical protein
MNHSNMRVLDQTDPCALNVQTVTHERITGALGGVAFALPHGGLALCGSTTAQQACLGIVVAGPDGTRQLAGVTHLDTRAVVELALALLAVVGGEMRLIARPDAAPDAAAERSH